MSRPSRPILWGRFLDLLPSDMNPTIELLNSHRSIRVYKDEPVPDEHVRAAVEAGQMASSSSAVQAYCLIRVRNQANREKIAELAGPQQKVAQCGAFFVVCGDTRRHRVAAARDGNTYDQRLEAFLVATIDASLFCEKMVIAFESLGYGVCYIGGLRNHIAEVDELLELPEGVYPLYGLCVGVPAEEPGPRPRLPMEGVLFEDKYPGDDEMLERLAEYDDGYTRYLTERGAKNTEGWSKRMGAKYATPERTHLGPYYKGKGAGLE